MVIDWNVVSSAATAVGSLATALGVCFGAWQIKVGKDQAQATFEDSLDQQYRSLSMELPVSVLIGEPVKYIYEPRGVFPNIPGHLGAAAYSYI